VQTDAAHVQGTPLGSANTDIDHVVHLVKPNERVSALINLLLAAPEEQVLAFARTRADVARVCEELHEAGFAVDALSGEMDQDARHRALSAFKRGKLQILVATDVAARGIDHQDIARVVQLEPPNDADTYTHRSGRTGRAGKKGKSSIMVQPAGMARLSALLKRAGVRFCTEPIPAAARIARAQDEQLFLELSGEPVAGDAVGEAGATPDARALGMAKRLVAAGRGEQALARLIERTRSAGTCEPRALTCFDPARTRQSEGKPWAARGPHAREPARRSGANGVVHNDRHGSPAWRPTDRDASRGTSSHTPRHARDGGDATGRPGRTWR
jgi:ATP-dependent RNA helicase DeaD